MYIKTYFVSKFSDIGGKIVDLSFKEKSAWGLLVGILVVAAGYFPNAIRIVETTDNPVALIAISVGGIVALIIIEAVYHAIIAAAGGDHTDERDALIDLKAERNGGFVLGIGLFLLVGHIIATSVTPERPEPSVLLVGVYIIAALTLSEVGKLVSQIWYYRAGV